MACKMCGMCCRYFANLIPVAQSPDIEWIKLHGGIVQYREIIGKQFYLYLLPCRCIKLTEDNKCLIHENKPAICKKLPNIELSILSPNECRFFDGEENEDKQTINIKTTK